MLLRKPTTLLIAFLVAWLQRSYANAEEAKISFEEKIYLSAAHHVPVSDVSIYGTKAGIVLDTAGSGAPMLTEQFAKRAKVIAPIQRFPSPVFLKKKIRLNFGSLNVGFPMVGVAKSGDTWFSKQNIAGIFNPIVVGPSLETDKNTVNSVVLDFLEKRFYGVQASNQQALDDYLDKRYAKQTKIVAPLSANKYYKVVIDGGIEGRQGVPVLIDTGANSSSFDQPYLAGIPSVKQGRVKNFLGQVFYRGETEVQAVMLQGVVIGDAKLNISDADTDSRVGPATSDEMKAYQGIIGMDLLKDCALAISYPQTITFYCAPPRGAR